ncbi:unnamed protein product, partial [Amoebophrya sp. A25]
VVWQPAKDVRPLVLGIHRIEEEWHHGTASQLPSASEFYYPYKTNWAGDVVIYFEDGTC